MATHSSVLAWRIPGTGEPGGLPSMGSHRVVFATYVSLVSNPVPFKKQLDCTVTRSESSVHVLDKSLSSDT